jgi:hypothetical protein
MSTLATTSLVCRRYVALACGAGWFDHYQASKPVRTAPKEWLAVEPFCLVVAGHRRGPGLICRFNELTSELLANLSSLVLVVHCPLERLRFSEAAVADKACDAKGTV